MYIQTKLSPNEFTKLILKARGPRREALEQGWGGPQASISTAAIGHSNPCRGAVRRMRTRIRLLAQSEPMRSIVGATQQEQRFD